MYLICGDRRILHRSASLVSPSRSIADFTFCPWNFSAFRIRGADRRSDPWRKRRRPSRNPPAATSATVASPPSAAGYLVPYREKYYAFSRASISMMPKAIVDAGGSNLASIRQYDTGDCC